MDHNDRYTIALGVRGRLVLRSRLRRRLDRHPGDRLIRTVDDEGWFRTVSARELAARLRGFYLHLAPSAPSSTSSSPNAVQKPSVMMRLDRPLLGPTSAAAPIETSRYTECFS
jgi:hypothetical protein